MHDDTKKIHRRLSIQANVQESVNVQMSVSVCLDACLQMDADSVVPVPYRSVLLQALGLYNGFFNVLCFHPSE